MGCYALIFGFLRTEFAGWELVVTLLGLGCDILSFGGLFRFGCEVDLGLID